MVIIDCHVHIYPFFNIGRAFRSAIDNLTRLAVESNKAEGIDFACLLAERNDCHFFKAILNGDLTLPKPFKLRERRQSHLLIEDQTSGKAVYVLPGRQIVSRERIEVLALGADIEIDDGEPLDFLLVNIREAGALPGICWSPGKWLFKRGKIVAELIEASGPRDLVLIDTSIRPAFSPQPVLMSRAQRCGINVLAGSDPFPLPDEEQRIGGYATLSHLILDHERPSQSLIEALTAPVSRAGKRLSPWKVFSRLRANAGLRGNQRPRR